MRRMTRPHVSLATTALGLRFESPFGVAAGFDKNGEMVRGLWGLGFGHIEVGTVTAVAQPGSEKPRLFRLIADRAVINRMGFNNEGAVAVAPRLRAHRMPSSRPIIGVNIGKSRVVDVDEALHVDLAGWAVAVLGLVVALGLARVGSGATRATVRHRLHRWTTPALAATTALGVLSALMQDRWVDHVTRIFAVSGIALPPFWFGLLLQLGFATMLGWRQMRGSAVGGSTWTAS